MKKATYFALMLISISNFAFGSNFPSDIPPQVGYCLKKEAATSEYSKCDQYCNVNVNFTRIKINPNPEVYEYDVGPRPTKLPVGLRDLNEESFADLIMRAGRAPLVKRQGGPGGFVRVRAMLYQFGLMEEVLLFQGEGQRNFTADSPAARDLIEIIKLNCSPELQDKLP